MKRVEEQELFYAAAFLAGVSRAKTIPSQAPSSCLAAFVSRGRTHHISPESDLLGGHEIRGQRVFHFTIGFSFSVKCVEV
jgi:hypothetical protein